MADTFQIVVYAVGAAGAVGMVVTTAVGIMWRSEKSAQKELVESLKRQARSSESRAIAAEQAKGVAERRAGELEMKYAYLKQAFKKAVDALNTARVWVDPGAMVGTVSDRPQWDDPSAVWHVEGAKQTDFFLGHLSEREEAERRRQRPLNPSTTDLELEDYLEQMRTPKPPR